MYRGVLAAAVVCVCVTAVGEAREDTFQFNITDTYVRVSPPSAAKRLPAFESLVPVPGIIDPSEQSSVHALCVIQALNGTDGVRGVRGSFVSRLFVWRDATGQLESFEISSGRFRTDRLGEAYLNLNIPTEPFAGGFKSGNVSAWTYTRSDFTNNKKVESVSLQCAKGANRSD